MAAVARFARRQEIEERCLCVGSYSLIYRYCRADRHACACGAILRACPGRNPAADMGMEEGVTFRRRSASPKACPAQPDRSHYRPGHTRSWRGIAAPGGRSHQWLALVKSGAFTARFEAAVDCQPWRGGPADDGEPAGEEPELMEAIAAGDEATMTAGDERLIPAASWAKSQRRDGAGRRTGRPLSPGRHNGRLERRRSHPTRINGVTAAR